MNISALSLITVNQILADVISETEDYDYRDFTKGWYTSQIQQCLEELSFDTFINILDDDYAFPSTTMILELPANTFNVRGLWVYNGSLGNPSDVQMVRIKSGAYVNGPSKSFFSENKAGQTQDPWIYPLSETTQDDLIWASMQNGSVHFPDKAGTYSFVHIRYNGTLTPIGDTPLIPQFFRQAVKLWVTLEYYRRMRKRNPRTYGSLFNAVHNELYAPFVGKWDVAILRSKSMDSKAISDYKEYLSKMNY